MLWTRGASLLVRPGSSLLMRRLHACFDAVSHDVMACHDFVTIASGGCRPVQLYFLQVARIASACCFASGLTGSALKLPFAVFAAPQSPFATSAFMSS
jgi:hypothetical protein